MSLSVDEAVMVFLERFLSVKFKFCRRSICSVFYEWVSFRFVRFVVFSFRVLVSILFRVFFVFLCDY